MRSTIVVGRIFLLISLFLNLTNTIFSQRTVLNWEVYHPKEMRWLPLGEKGSAQEALLTNGLLPDPFVGINESLYLWMEEYDWVFRTTFMGEGFDQGKVDLVFPNVDTHAEIKLNGQLLGKTENAFHPYRFDIQRFIRADSNLLEVTFQPPVRALKQRYHQLKTPYPAPNDVGIIPVAPLCRKPQYHFGWDWSMRMQTMGFWEPVYIERYAKNLCVQHSIQTRSIQTEEAIVGVETIWNQYFTDSVRWVSSLAGELWLQPRGKMLKREIVIHNPQLWWPRGEGEPHLYNDSWQFYDEKGQLLDEIEVNFGVRTSELKQKKDESGTSYEIWVNGRPVFCKGGNMIPQDIFIARITADQTKKLLSDMAAAHFNMVRVWGGGYYPSEDFYSQCDALGLMVWQDAMFACAMYPGDSAFLENVRQEFDYQIPRISSHPSVVLFNGNNEVDVAWKNWGFQIKYRIFGKDAERIQQEYVKLFQTLLPERVELWSTVPYIHTSPLSNWGKPDFYRHGSQHYWGVWHGKDELEGFDKNFGRFNAEYGFQSFPQMSTVQRFATPESQSLFSEVMKHHQKSYVGNKMIEKHTQRLFGEATDFEDFVFKSQLTQAKAVGMAISAHRIEAPTCMGTLYWQVNDCWPAPTWSSIDVYGNWKPLHYRVQLDYETLTVLERIQELGKETYHLVSDKLHPVDVFVETKVYALSGLLLYEDVQAYSITQWGNIQVGNNLYSPRFQEQDWVVQFTVKQKNKVLVNRTFLHQNQISPKPDPSSFSWSIRYDSVQNLTFLTVVNQKFLADFTIYTANPDLFVKGGSRQLLPGKHDIIIEGRAEEQQIRIQYR